jgi:signal transduction histidine kinase
LGLRRYPPFGYVSRFWVGFVEVVLKTARETKQIPLFDGEAYLRFLNPQSFMRAERASTWIAASALVCSAFFIVLWVFFPELKEFVAWRMKFNSAWCLFLGSGSLLLFSALGNSRVAKAAGFVLTAGMMFLSGVTLLEYVTGTSFGIDEWWIADFRNSESARFPGRMAPNTAAAYLLSSIALISLGLSERRGRVPFRTMICSLVGLIALFTFLGYLYHVPALYQVSNFLRMSPFAAVGVVVLCWGILLCKPRERPVELLLGTTLGGVTARRLLATALLLPSFMGWLRIEGQRVGWYDLEIGTAILVVSFSVVYAFMILKTAASLNKIDEEQKRAREQLAAAVRARDEFLSIASHELKTPLTALKLQSQIRERQVVRNDTAILNPPAFLEMCRSDAKQVERLVRLVDDMLDIGRLGAGGLSMRFEKFDFAEMVREVSDRLKPQFALSGSSLEVECRGNLFGDWDRERMEQVVMNLLTNALKYGDGKPVKVEAVESGECVRLSVKDRGLGIEPENQSRIFNRFERAISPQVIGGMGLGLYITKQIVVAHKGTIQVESEPGKGSTFIAFIPKKADYV